VLATEWNEFKQLDFSRIMSLMRTPVILDGRNLWDGEALRAMGFTYFGVGRGVTAVGRD
jgi:UDPglucose 6-dehydrogenase